jgi:hypothetical protein
LVGIFKPKPPQERARYSWKPKAKKASSRYELILDGEVRKYPDGREVCQDNSAGRREYGNRVQAMVQRQGYKCCLCLDALSVHDATFEHTSPRGMGAAFRDDRIIDENGTEMNGAAHWNCNVEKGSKRV